MKVSLTTILLLIATSGLTKAQEGQVFNKISCDSVPAITEYIDCSEEGNFWAVDRSGLEKINFQFVSDSLEKKRLGNINEAQEDLIEQYKETLKASEELHPGPLEGLKQSAPYTLPLAALSIILISS